jgi:predicted nucleic acid-binding protein
VLLIDNSAFARLAHPNLPAERSDEMALLIERREIAVCLPFLLEAGYSARDAGGHRVLMERFARLPRLLVTPEVERTALVAQGELARAGHHRLPPVDLIIAAVAHEHDAGVLHYDGDYDLLLTKTSLRFASVWLAERGSI